MGALELILSSIWRFPYQISLLNWKNCQMTVVMRKNPLQITSDLQRVFPYDHCHLTRFFTSSKITRIQFRMKIELKTSSKAPNLTKYKLLNNLQPSIDPQCSRNVGFFIKKRLILTIYNNFCWILIPNYWNSVFNQFWFLKRIFLCIM